jgi:biotin-dependent carboxylase-like uncharacterized protein
MTLQITAVGPLATVQDHGRPGWAHLGVPRAGALDGPAADLANRLVGNHDGAAVLELLLGGLSVVSDAGVWVAVTGAPCPVRVAAREVAFASATWLAPGAELIVGEPSSGLRSYLAVAGGIAVEPVLGSRSTDTLAWVGPPRLAVGDLLPIGRPSGQPQPHDTPRVRRPGPLRLHPGPRGDWWQEHDDPDVLARLCRTAYTVGPDSDRVGLRLLGEPLALSSSAELPSEGIVLGAVQLPPDGLPVVFLADHPTTGGYPVVAVVEPDDLWQCAQLRPGEPVLFTPAAARG